MTARTAIYVILAAAAFSQTACAETVEAREARRSGDVVSHWFLGPFFEYREAVLPAAGPAAKADAVSRATFLAFRPFYSSTVSESTIERDFLWPVATSHSRAGDLWWRAFFVAYGNDDGDRESSWNFTLLPVFFCGAARAGGEGYWGVFPLYGTHPHLLLMDDLRFAAWPVWMDYRIKGEKHGAILWPLVTWKEDGRGTFGVWPVCSHARRRESDHWYVLWPIATWARYDRDRDTGGEGYSWMFWPLAGRVERERERQWLFIPPFFSLAETLHVRRWRLPWPFVEIENGTRRDRVSIWPFYERIDGYPYSETPAADGKRAADEHVRRYLWVLAEDSELVSETTRSRRLSVFPFWTSEKREEKGKDGAWRETASFLRIWPFWRFETDRGRKSRRMLDLVPVRHAEGFDRNWAPFWTLWSREENGRGKCMNSLFWNFIMWETDCD